MLKKMMTEPRVEIAWGNYLEAISSCQPMKLEGKIVKVAQQLAKEFKIEKGYRLITNVGAASGQVIFHLHFHLIGGKSLGAIG